MLQTLKFQPLLDSSFWVEKEKEKKAKLRLQKQLSNLLGKVVD